MMSREKKITAGATLIPANTKRGFMKNTQTKTLILSMAIMTVLSVTAFAQRDNLSTAQWKLTQAYGRPVTRSTAYFEINIGRTRFMGNTGCNQMFGAVKVRGSRIDFANIGATKRACKLMDGNVAEDTFLRALNEAVRYRQNGNQLSLYDRRGRTILKFKIMVKPSPGDDDNSDAIVLGDKKWVLESIKNRRTLAAIKGAFVVFDPNKGSAGGDTSCNVFGGSYASANKTLAVTDIISTMRACEEGDKMEVEREFLAGLRNANRYEIRAARLFIYRGEQLLLTLRGEPKQ